MGSLSPQGEKESLDIKDPLCVPKDRVTSFHLFLDRQTRVCPTGTPTAFPVKRIPIQPLTRLLRVPQTPILTLSILPSFPPRDTAPHIRPRCHPCFLNQTRNPLCHTTGVGISHWPLPYLTAWSRSEIRFFSSRSRFSFPKMAFIKNLVINP